MGLLDGQPKNADKRKSTMSQTKTSGPGWACAAKTTQARTRARRRKCVADIFILKGQKKFITSRLGSTKGDMPGKSKLSPLRKQHQQEKEQ
ncbi:hypothetical protein ElyMa_006900200 [Elysia marginata]|uniref:Uncharacterized protein n=1 Tax=Elysia marginata TaxID=1093978 RepID=A0AAV4JDQ7_9GAST|nr:hypothetical protein ElyMa_006900200 [Elysia marginata]